MEGLKKKGVAGRADVLYGVGLVPFETGGQVLSSFGEAGARLGLILGRGFVVVIFFIAVLRKWFDLVLA